MKIMRWVAWASAFPIPSGLHVQSQWSNINVPTSMLQLLNCLVGLLSSLVRFAKILSMLRNSQRSVNHSLKRMFHVEHC